MPVISTNTAANSAVRYLNINSHGAVGVAVEARQRLAHQQGIRRRRRPRHCHAHPVRDHGIGAGRDQRLARYLGSADRRRRRLQYRRHPAAHEIARLPGRLGHRDGHGTRLHPGGIRAARRRGQRHRDQHALQRAEPARRHQRVRDWRDRHGRLGLLRHHPRDDQRAYLACAGTFLRGADGSREISSAEPAATMRAAATSASMSTV